MGVYVKKEDRVKRSRAKKGTSLKSALSKSAFVYKAKNGGKTYQRTANDRMFAKGASKEVMVKITGAAKTKQGIKNAIDYIGREGDIPLMDEQGQQFKSDDLAILKNNMIDISDSTKKENLTGKANPDLTKNLVFSPPVTAKVKPEEMLNAVKETLNKKYPDSRFVLAYHDDKKHHPHVHAVMRLRGDTNKAIRIRKEDLRELRTGFCKELQSMGYDVKATHKQQIGLKQKLEADHNSAPKRQKGVYEVVDFGYAKYQNKPENSYQHFVRVKTLNKGTESTFWGKELGELCEREKVAKGDLIRLKKSGSVEVKVPKVDNEGNRTGWKEVKRNQWTLENLGVSGIDRTQPLKSNVDLTTPEQLAQKRIQQARFRQNASDMLRKEKSISIGVSIG
ncbi:TPA: relaxase/mobilization nuclease domain-containing protein [Salmonella enterica]|nr:relaxase/mobilization nuclease domain-containing protein [Salmonella enterica]